MSIVVIPAALAEQLRAAGDGAELRDESGRCIGELRRRPDWEVLGFQRPDDIPKAELAAMLAEGGKTYTTAEVLEHLRGLK